jgi:hypothetical protein
MHNIASTTHAGRRVTATWPLFHAKNSCPPPPAPKPEGESSSPPAPSLWGRAGMSNGFQRGGGREGSMSCCYIYLYTRAPNSTRANHMFKREVRNRRSWRRKRRRSRTRRISGGGGGSCCTASSAVFVSKKVNTNEYPSMPGCTSDVPVDVTKGHCSRHTIFS